MDAHFHLYISLKQARCQNFREYEGWFRRDPHLQLRNAIVNYVYPDNWYKAWAVQDPHLQFSYWIHPLMVGKIKYE
jgi:hypothetical protein